MQRLLWRGTEKIRLPKLSYELFLSLVRHAPGIVSTDQLLTEVWGDVVVGEETVKQRISLLRQALNDSRDDPLYIESIRGVGYRLIAPVSSAEIVEKRPGRSRAVLFAGAAVTLLGLGIWVVNSDRQDLPGEREILPRSIAVLPFEDLSTNGDQGYFSDGIHEEIITQLSKIDSLAVTSRTSVMPFRSAGMNIKEIAGDLGVGLIIEGSVRHTTDRVRVTVQLIDAVKDEHLWAENYDRPLSVSDLFEIQSDVAEQISTALQTELSSEEVASLQRLPTDSIEAYDNYLLGRYHVWRGNADDLRRSIEYFEIALAADANFSEAYVGLGQALSFVGTSYGWLAPNEVFPDAGKNVEKALSLRPDAGDALSLRGDILTWYEWQWSDAERAYLRALEVSNEGVLGYMILLSILDRHKEAIELMEGIIARFPRDHWVRSNAAWRFLAAGDPQRAIAEADIAIGIDDRFGDAFASRGWANFALGNTDFAIADFEKNVSIQHRSPASLAALAVAQARAGRRDDANKLLQEIIAQSSKRFVAPEEIARVHAALGNIDEVFEWLERGFEARSRGMIFLNINRSWDPVREDPRFQDILERMNLRID